jgi:tetratricopeptide (TPR) repeat protein
LRSHSGFPVAWHVLGQTYLQLGKKEAAIAAFENAGEASLHWSWGLGQGLAFAGRMEEARALARELEKAEVPDYWGLAEVHAAIGDLDRAVYWLEQGYEARRDWIPWLEVNPFLAPLHDHPGFREIVRRLDLPVKKA